METIIQNFLSNENIHLKSEDMIINSKSVHLCTVEDCDKIFKDKRSWEEHMRFHKGDKPFIW